MKLKLEVLTDFMYSGYLPERCIFSGRRDEIEKIDFTIRIANPWTFLFVPLLLPFLGFGNLWVELGALAIAWAISKATTRLYAFKIFVHRGAQSRWELARGGGWLVLFLMLPTLPVVISLCAAQHRSEMTMATLAAVESGLLVAGLLWVVLGRLFTTSLRRQDENHIVLSFPARLADLHAEFAAAYQEFLIPFEEGRRRAKGFRSAKINYGAPAAAVADPADANDDDDDDDGGENGDDAHDTKDADETASDADEAADHAANDTDDAPPESNAPSAAMADAETEAETPAGAEAETASAAGANPAAVTDAAPAPAPVPAPSHPPPPDDLEPPSKH